MYLENIPKLGKNYVVINYSSQTSHWNQWVHGIPILTNSALLWNYSFLQVKLLLMTFHSHVIDKADSNSTVEIIRIDLSVSQEILSAWLMSEKMLDYFCLLIYNRYW